VPLAAQCFWGHSNAVANDQLDSARVLLLRKINDARTNPAAAAAALGFTTSQLIEKFPELEEVLPVGLPALAENDSLNAVAFTHTLDMLQNNFYGYDSSDGGSWESRLQGAGFQGAPVGETLGVVAFQNYMDMNTAVETLYTNLLLDELDLNRSWKEPNLLNSKMTQIGLSLCSGQIDLNGRRTNVYLLTCDLAGESFVSNLSDDDMLVAESEFVQLINQARDTPWLVAESFGVEGDVAPGEENKWQRQLAPLTQNASLKRVAAAKIEEMMAADGASEKDGDTDLERSLIETGFIPITLGELRWIVGIADHMTLNTLIQSAFKDMLLTELASAEGETLSFLNAGHTEIGVKLEFGRYDFGKGPENALFINCILGSREDRTKKVVGVVYEDKNRNGLYDMGEGIPGRSIIGYGAGLHLKTDKAGGFLSNIESGSYWMILFSQEEPLEIQTIDVNSENVWVTFQQSLEMAN
jgi:hypothetical protein